MYIDTHCCPKKFSVANPCDVCRSFPFERPQLCYVTEKTFHGSSSLVFRPLSTFSTYPDLTTMTDAWFENAVMPDGLPIDGCRPEEAQALKSYLRDEITIDQASVQITLPTTTCSEPGDPLLYLWGLLQDAMLEISGCQKKIVHLLLRIQQLPDVKIEETQHVWALSNKDEVLWKDLPGFANSWYDGNWWIYQSHWRRDATYATPEWKDKAISQAIAEAMMARSSLMGDDVDVGFDGLARLADTLEDDQADLEIEVLMVREWVIHAGDLLRGLCVAASHTSNSVDVSEHKAQASRRMRDTNYTRGAWLGAKGPSLERWEFWKDRLRRIKEDLDNKDVIREAAKSAIEAMK
jgi:hypothetical protein